MSYDGWCVTRAECYKELGWALYYMDYLNDGDPWPEDQRKRVEVICREGSENFGKKEGQAYWQDLLRRIRDETENMC